MAKGTPRKDRRSGTARTGVSSAVMLDSVAAALAAVSAPKRSDEDHWRRLGRDLARVLGAVQLENAFGGAPLWRCVFRALIQMDNTLRERFLRAFFAKAIPPYGEHVGAFLAGLFRFLPFRQPLHLVAHSDAELIQIRQRQISEVKAMMARAEHAAQTVIGVRGRLGTRFWPAGVGIVDSWEEARGIARDAEWHVLNQTGGPTLRSFYQGNSYAWEVLKVLIGYIVDAAVDEWGDQLVVPVEQVRTVWRAAGKMQRDLETLAQYSAGALAAGRLQVEGSRPNPFLPFVWVFELAGWPIGQVGEVSWVFVPPLQIVAT